MIWIFYYITIYLMVAGIRVASLWSRKAGDWIAGRRQWREQIRSHPSKQGERIWFHVSSLGEFEQARPVIERIKAARPATAIILTFFSPSGYRKISREHYPASVFYLPADLPGHAETWIRTMKPDMAVFVKYDLWPGYLRALQKAGIPSILISAHWLPEKKIASWRLPPARSLLMKMDRIFLQRPDHLDFFRQRGFGNLEVAGDTRIDRVLLLPEEAPQKIPGILQAAGPFDIVAGSTWEPDDTLLCGAIRELGLRAIIAPHEVTEQAIRRLVSSCPGAVRLSEMKGGSGMPAVVIVDSTGLLSSLYALGKVAYVGGGFGAGIHNTLEPMAHGRPVIFGPRYRRFPEAVDMVREKGAFSVSGKEQFIGVLGRLLQPGEAEKAGKICLDFLLRHAGASEKVAAYIMESIPFRREI